MANYCVKFNGVVLDDYLVATVGLNRSINTSRENKTKDTGRRGAIYLDYRNDQLYIPMPFVLVSDLIAKRRELAKILDVKEPAELIFGDEENVIYYALPSGDTQVDENNFIGKGTITWQIPDGQGYLINDSISTNNGTNQITLTNNGNATAYPVFDFEHTTENGFIGVVSDYGIAQYGLLEEVDGVYNQKSVRAINEEFNTVPSSWDLNPSGFDLWNITKNGSFTANGSLSGDFVPTQTGTNGAVLVKTLDAQEIGKNFSLQSWVGFNFAENTQVGYVQFSAWDEGSNHIASLGLIKNTNNDWVLPVCYVNGQQKGYSDSITNRFANFYGLVQIDKFNDQISFKVQMQSTNFVFKTKFNDSSLADKKVKYISIAYMAFADRVPCNITTALTDLWVHDANVYLDIPNSIGAGTTIRFDHAKSKIFRRFDANSGFFLDMLSADIGNKYFGIPPGETTVKFVFSSWANTPNITATLKQPMI